VVVKRSRSDCNVSGACFKSTPSSGPGISSVGNIPAYIALNAEGDRVTRSPLQYCFISRAIFSPDRMFPAGNPISHVIPNWMRYSGPEYSSPLPFFASTLDRVAELAIQPVALLSFDVLARRSLQCVSRRNWESSFEPRGPRGVVCQPPTLPRGCDLEPFPFPSLRLLASLTAVTFPRSPSAYSCLTIGNDANSPLRHFGHVSERFIPVSPGSAVFSEPTLLIFLSSREVNIPVVPGLTPYYRLCSTGPEEPFI
jgi:hypothetical protein